MTAGSPASPIGASVALAAARAQAELLLLAAIAAGGRWTLALARRAGVCAEHFGQDDTWAIFTALEVAAASGRIRDRAATALLCRFALKHLRLWRDDDERSFAGGLIWGPGPLAALFCTMDSLDAENVLSGLAAQLLGIVRQQQLARAAVARGGA